MAKSRPNPLPPLHRPLAAHLQALPQRLGKVLREFAAGQQPGRRPSPEAQLWQGAERLGYALGGPFARAARVLSRVRTVAGAVGDVGRALRAFHTPAPPATAVQPPQPAPPPPPPPPQPAPPPPPAARAPQAQAPTPPQGALPQAPPLAGAPQPPSPAAPTPAPPRTFPTSGGPPIGMPPPAPPPPVTPLPPLPPIPPGGPAGWPALPLPQPRMPWAFPSPAAPVPPPVPGAGPGDPRNARTVLQAPAWPGPAAPPVPSRTATTGLFPGPGAGPAGQEPGGSVELLDAMESLRDAVTKLERTMSGGEKAKPGQAPMRGETPTALKGEPAGPRKGATPAPPAGDAAESIDKGMDFARELGTVLSTVAELAAALA